MARSQGSGKRKAIRIKKTKKKLKSALFAWSDSANQFNNKLKEFGYIGYDRGVCHGVACVAAHAMLLNQVDQFDRDLQRIQQSHPQDNQNQYEDRALLEAVELCHQPDKYPHLFPIHATNPNARVA